MTKNDIKKTNALINKIEKAKDVIAKKRDELRDLVDELNDIHQDAGETVFYFEGAIRDMRDTLDTLSQHL